MYLFKQHANGTWGDSIAHNDDGVWQFATDGETDTDDLAPWSYLDVSLDAGDYAMLVKGKHTTTYGDYHVSASCSAGGPDDVPGKCK